MSTEARLRDALRAQAAHIEPRDAWAQIESRFGETPREKRNPMRVAAIAALAALVGAGGVAAWTAANQDTNTPVDTKPGVTTTIPTTTTTTTTAPAPATPRYLWPLDTMSVSYDTPAKVADAFARGFMNMPSPNIDTYRAGDAQSGEIDIRPFATGGPVTTLNVRQDSGRWHVVSAEAANLELDSPAALAPIQSPLRLTGRSVAYEGTVRVAVVRYGTTMQCLVPTDVCGSDPGVFANTFFTGSGDEKRPFTTDVNFTSPDGEYGYVILWTESAQDGTTAEATVRLVRWGGTPR